MYEALRLSQTISLLLNEEGVEDTGAGLSILVTDRAGNVAEVTYDEDWQCDEGFDQERAIARLRLSKSEPAKVTLVAVKSSNIKAIGYDWYEQLLYVLFNGEALYMYWDVTLREFEDFLNAPSKGSHFQQLIRPNHRYMKLDSIAYIVRSPKEEGEDNEQ